MEKTIDVADLTHKLSQDQMKRFSTQDKLLGDFLSDEHEELVTQAILVLERVKKNQPTMKFQW